MKTVLFVHGGKVADEEPAAHFRVRTLAALAYYAEHRLHEDIVFVVSGRWLSVTDTYTLTEAEIGKRFILRSVPDATVIKEDISVELIGNYAFSKPLIAALGADRTVVFTTELLRGRTERIVRKVFAGDPACEVRYLADDVTDRASSLDREAQAVALFDNLFADVADGDDGAVRDVLLYRTPYYFKGTVDDRAFFDSYWNGGYEHYLHSRTFYKT